MPTVDNCGDAGGAAGAVDEVGTADAEPAVECAEGGATVVVV